MLHSYIYKSVYVSARMSEHRPRRNLTEWVGQHQELSPLFADFQRSFDCLPQLPRSVLPLCKIRMDQLHGMLGENESQDCDVANNLADLTKEVRQWTDSDQFSDAEKACLAFTEVYAMDVHAITDAQADAVKEHVGEPGLVALVQALGVFYGSSRLRKLWRIGGDLSAAELHP